MFWSGFGWVWLGLVGVWLGLVGFGWVCILVPAIILAIVVPSVRKSIIFSLPSLTKIEAAVLAKVSQLLIPPCKMPISEQFGL